MRTVLPCELKSFVEAFGALVLRLLLMELVQIPAVTIESTTAPLGMRRSVDSNERSERNRLVGRAGDDTMDQILLGITAADDSEGFQSASVCDKFVREQHRGIDNCNVRVRSASSVIQGCRQ